MTDIEKHLIKAGVKNLREFGYPDCTEENILADPIYSAFFKSMLEENKGKGVDKEINSLLARMENDKVELPSNRDVSGLCEV